MADTEQNTQVDQVDQDNTLAEDGVEVDPWTAKGKFNDAVYQKLVEQFGVSLITPELLERFERVTGHPPHRFLRRRLFFAHRGLSEILDDFEAGKPIFIYTGRGPSGEMHIGHRIAMDFTVWLQKVLNAVVVFQIADDEKFWFKDLTFQQVDDLGRQNLSDIIALGFDPEKTFIFSNHVYKSEPAYKRVVDDMANDVRLTDIQSIFGISKEGNHSIGQAMWPVYQSAAAFSKAFGPIFRGENIRCLVAYAIDQDPYFRLCRDVAPKLGFHKPCSIMCQFLPALEGDSKMSTTPTNGESRAVFMSDSPAQIKKKINKFGFSGGRDTLEEHRRLGGDTKVDVAYQWLRHFLDDDDELERIRVAYESGEMLTGELKARCIEVVSAMALDHQAKRDMVTPAIIRECCEIDGVKGYDFDE
jgi:tryptophanyl-tRNA synthetase